MLTPEQDARPRTLWIAARPSAARAIASALSQASYERGDGCFTTDHHTVSWCGGHLLELAEPEAYGEQFKHWRLEQLPILPGQDGLPDWQLEEKPRLRAQLDVLRRLLAQASLVVHAGDPDREGQWLVDEVLHHLHNTLPVKRLLIHDLNTKALRKAIQSVLNDRDGHCDNVHFAAPGLSAMARSRADWLYGLNMTRAYTLLGRHSGHEGVLSVGRVQTPLLSLVVRRDEQIEHFRAEKTVELFAKFKRETELSFRDAVPVNEYCYGSWVGNESLGLVKQREFYEPIEQAILGKRGAVLEREDQHHVLSPPLPPDLATLQIEAALRFGYSAQEVLECCQYLYEECHLVSYPRTDNRYLPESFHEQSGDVLEAISAVVTQFAGDDVFQVQAAIQHADSWKKQAAFDDRKVAGRHAIVPVASHNSHTLDEKQQRIYGLIAAFYVAQFHPDHQVTDTTMLLGVGHERFRFSSSVVTQRGWHDVITPVDENGDVKTVAAVAMVPPWQVDDAVNCEDVQVKEKLTRPLPRFTDATLMQALASIAPFVESEELRRDLQQFDGLGTDATRAAMIDTLLKRNYLMRVGRHIFSTQLGRDLVHALPPQAASVDMTARWERRLAEIATMDGATARVAAADFVADVARQVGEFVQSARQKRHIALTSPDEVLGLKTAEKPRCPSCQSLLVLRKGKHGEFWGCSSYPDCRVTVPDKPDKQGNHHPDFVAHAGGVSGGRKARTLRNQLDKACPECGKPMVKRVPKSGKRAFAGCSGYPECRHTEPLLTDEWPD